MLDVEDDFPYYSDDPELKQSDTEMVVPQPSHEDQEFKVLLRFLIGSAVEGNDEFQRRARIWQAELENNRLADLYAPSVDESQADRLRFAMIGFFFDALDTWSDRLQSLQHSSAEAYQAISNWLDPLMNSSLLRPARNNLDNVIASGEALLESWIARGRREEQLSRSLVRDQAYEDMVDGMLDYLAQKPEVRDLVQQQSVGVAGELVRSLRTRSTDMDSYLEDRANAILGRGNQPASPVDQA
jgi:hypothetical protein